MSTPVLQVQGVSKRFGGLQALSEVGLTIMPGQIYGLIGPNGAGKTTFFNVITGMYTPDAGQFLLQGQPYEPTAVHDVARAGIARTFQNIRLFGEMTALENVMVGRHVRTDSGVWGAVFRSRGFVAQERAMAEHAQALLEEVGLGESAGLKARTLSYGDQRRLEIARALACEPRFMLLDEPFAGVDPISIIDIQKIIVHLRERGIGILITEHNVRETLGTCDRAYILAGGRVILADIVGVAGLRHQRVGQRLPAQAVGRDAPE